MSNENERDIGTLREDIEETRQRIAGEIEAIGERLTPAHAKEVAMEKIVEMKERAIDSVRSSIRNAARTTQDAGAHLGSAARENPIPTAMVCLGAGWLLYKAVERAREPQLEMNFEGFESPVPIEDEGNRIREMARSTRDRITSATGSARERVGRAAHVVRERSGALATRGREGAVVAWHRSQGAYEQNPLAFGAGAVLVGLGIGMLLPPTEREDRLLGERRERVLERARGAAREAKDVALESVKERVRQARESARERDIVEDPDRLMR
jgi:hypothetical protein